MNRRLPALVIATLLVSMPCGPVLEAAVDLSDLARQFETSGLEPVPGQRDMLVEGGVIGVFRGAPGKDDAKPYVLVMAGATAAESLSRLVDVGTQGAMIDGRQFPPSFARLGRHVIVAYWTSADAVGEGVVDLDQVAAHIDMSGLGSAPGGRVVIRAAGSSPDWPRLIEQTNIPVGLDLELDDAPDLGSLRAAALFSRNIAGVQLTASASASDSTAGTSGSDNVSAFAALLAASLSRLDEAPAFRRVEAEGERDSRPTAARPYTGTIPDYAGDVEGLRLAGVLDGGPAEAAGLAEGDIIIALGETAIEDVYGYAEALDTLIVGKPVAVVFIRDGERLETTITPLARD